MGKVSGVRQNPIADNAGLHQNARCASPGEGNRGKRRLPVDITPPYRMPRSRDPIKHCRLFRLSANQVPIFQQWRHGPRFPAPAFLHVVEMMRPASITIFSTEEMNVSLIETMVLQLEMIISKQKTKVQKPEMIISECKTIVEATKKMVEAMITMVEATYAMVCLTKTEALTTEMIFSVAQKMLFAPKKIAIVANIMVLAAQNIISDAKKMIAEARKMLLVPPNIVRSRQPAHRGTGAGFTHAGTD
jgi:hypothetical protein